MTNAEVVKKFIKGEIRGKTKNLYIDSNKLVNYSTVIAQWNGTEEQTKELAINVNYYSRSTSTIQFEILKQIKQARKNGYNFILVMNGTSDRVEQFTNRLQAE